MATGRWDGGSRSGQSLSASYSGFVSGQGPRVLGGTLALATTTTNSSNVGAYTSAVTSSGLTSSNYAISFVWNDGHSTGIYSWNFLREHCQCQECKTQRSALSGQHSGGST